MDPFLGEIRLFPYNRIPAGWVACNGQNLPIQQNAALYALIGNTYGGTQGTNYNFPNLNGRVIVGMQSGVVPEGLTPYLIGTADGAETVTLTIPNLPVHNHSFAVATGYNAPQPKNNVLGDPNNFVQGTIVQNAANANLYSSNMVGQATLNTSSVTNEGGGGPHENRMPYLAMIYCIATVGIWPSRQ